MPTKHVTHPNAQAFPHEDPGGLTKREYLAALAMQGLLANEIQGFRTTADDAVRAADCLIDSLNRSEEESS